MDHQQKIYITSCAGENVEHLSALLDRLEASLIDVLFNPQQATRLVFTRDYLKLLLKRRYVHISALGDRAAGTSVRSREETAKPQIQNLQLGMQIIKSLTIDVVIMCDCKPDENCHRLLIGDAFRKENFEVIEINNWQIT